MEITVERTLPGGPPSKPAKDRGPTAENVELPWLTFPPFPAPPPGVTIVPFKDFKPRGIVIAIDPAPDHVELDGDGIPTVALAVKHDGTAMERRKRKMNARNAVRRTATGALVRLPWDEIWEDGEELRKVVVDPAMPRVDRLHEASHAFQRDRPMPDQAQQRTAPRFMWDSFRVYIGLIANRNMPALKKRKQMQQAQAEADAAAEEASDSDLDDTEVPAKPKTHPVTQVTDAEAFARQAERQAQKPPPPPKYTEEERRDFVEMKREERAVRMDSFFDDTERNIKTFLSSHFRDKGYMWETQYRRDGPILVAFFLRFLLRSRVLPEHERGLRKALAVAERAQTELPQTANMSRALADGALTSGCGVLWGNMAQTMVWSDVAVEEAAVMQAAGGVDAMEVEVISPETVGSLAREAAPAWGDPPQPVEEPGADATATGGDDWGAPAEVLPPAAANGWGDDNPEEAWGAPQENKLLAALGPTALPLTHTTGVVERSSRRIKAVIPPPSPDARPAKKARRSASGAQSATAGSAGPDAEAVERDLEARFAKLVLAPWGEWHEHAGADVQHPQILPDSRGAVVSANEPAAVEAAPAGAHNPWKDDITVLIDADAAKDVVLEMGLQSTFVQLARVDPAVPVEVDQAQYKYFGVGQKKTRGGPGVPVQPTKLWYMASIEGVLPSFHVEQPKPPAKEKEKVAKS